MTEKELRERARVARAEYPATESAFNRVRQAIFDRWASTPMSAIKEREQLFRQVQALDATAKAMLEAMSCGDEAIQDYKDRILSGQGN